MAITIREAISTYLLVVGTDYTLPIFNKPIKAVTNARYSITMRIEYLLHACPYTKFIQINYRLPHNRSMEP